MLTVIKQEQFTEGKDLIQLECLSTDTKPTEEIANGSLCLELDTGDFYYFDGTDDTWKKIGG